ncbi:MAG TPA: hypothetical protein V6C96_00660, partial [Vampirovibrionales bacterium]
MIDNLNSNYVIELPSSNIEISKDLLNKYDKSGPRYTSYPTAPEWSSLFSSSQWKSAIERSNELGTEGSLYFHLPFCRSACYYCACNYVVSQNEDIKEQYISALFREIQLVSSLIKNKKITQLHFGGGTPTYLSLEQF